MNRVNHLLSMHCLEVNDGARGTYRSSHLEVFLGKGVLKICSKFTREHPCRSAILMKLLKQLRHGHSLVNLLYIFRTPFPKNTSGRLHLGIQHKQLFIKRFLAKFCLSERHLKIQIVLSSYFQSLNLGWVIGKILIQILAF